MSVLKETARCQECGIIMCPSCYEVMLLQSSPNQEICPSCGSVHSLQLLGTMREMTVSDLLNLRNTLKTAAYQPVIVLKKAKFLLEQLYHLQKHFWVVPYLEMISNIPNILTSIEPFIISYLREFVTRLRNLLKHLNEDTDLVVASKDLAYPNLGFEGAILLIQAESFMKAITKKLKPLKESLEEIKSIVNIFVSVQEDEMQLLRKKFNFHVNELIIAYFKNLSIKHGGIRYKRANLMLTTDRLLIFRKSKSGIFLDRSFLREEVIDSLHKKTKFSGERLEIVLNETNRMIIKADPMTLTQIQLTIQHGWTRLGSYYGTLPLFHSDQIINDLKIIHDHLSTYRSHVDHILKSLTSRKTHVDPTTSTKDSAGFPETSAVEHSLMDVHPSMRNDSERNVTLRNDLNPMMNFPLIMSDSQKMLRRDLGSETSTLGGNPSEIDLISPYQSYLGGQNLFNNQDEHSQRTLPEFFSKNSHRHQKDDSHLFPSSDTNRGGVTEIDLRKIQYWQQRVQDLRLEREICARILNELKSEKNPLNLRERYELIAEYEKRIKEIDRELEFIYQSR